MSTSPARFGKRAAARLRAIRRRAADWRRRTRRALTLAAVAAGSMVLPSVAEAQVGQMAMSPSAGVVNRALAGFKRLDENGPGWMYWGVNGADRGLGYVGSYMTVGGFIPYAVDDLGGFWSADLRGHLSVNGGFFSNVGMVRKQFIGGTLLGIGVYWDYDGDQDQYPAYGTPGTIYGQFGHAYNQVGVSGEWLTDWGNLRSNGYIPVGTTAYVAGAPGTPFYDNYVMCQYGLDAALAGADLEVGAYIPGLSDWAGMISVGGYALGNARYDWQVGPEEGKDVVPWFGGVYTRLDMTFLENWDFSLQANNDSYFDWTGFARLTYRMGRSRWRNVPDQMEQPMMRNEHIVRAHETPIVALNPVNGTPWRVIHVDNSASPAGNGTAEAPYTTIAAGNAAATNPWDIVLVARGLSRVNLDNASADFGDVSNAYGGTFTPLAANQYFIGEGTPFNIDTLNCGFENIGGRGGIAPVLSNPTGPSIVLSQGLVASNFSIVNSAVGIGGTGNLSSPERGSVARHIDIYATDPTASTQGIAITDATGKATFRDVNIGKQVATKQGLLLEWTMSNGSVLVDGGDPVIDYADGTIRNTSGHILHVNNTLGGEVSLTANPGQPFYERGTGVLVENAAGNVTVTNANPGMQSLDIVSQADGIKVVGSSGVQTFNGVVIAGVSSVNGTVTPNNGYAGVNLQNNAGTTNFDDLAITLTDSANASTGFLAVNDNVINVTGDSSVTVRNAPAVSMTNVADVDITFKTVTSTNSLTNGLLLDDVGGLFAVSSALNVTDALGDGLVIRNSPDLTFTSAVTNVNTVATAPARANGIVLQKNAIDAKAAQLGQVKVATKNGAGLVVTDAGATSTGGTIDATGGAAIAANDADLNLTLASVSSTNSNGAGVDLTEARGGVTIESTTVADPVGNGINAVDNVPGFSADFGATTVTGIGGTAAGAIGVNLVNAVEPVPPTRYSFDTLDVETVAGAGLVTKNGGVVNFNAPATISAAGGAAINLENTQGTTGGVAGSGFTFQSLTSTESVSNGVRLNNLNSDLRVLGATAIDSADGPSILITDTVAPPATDSIAFNTVTITNRDNVGVRVDGVYGQVSFQNLSIDNGSGVAGDAVEILNTTNPFDPVGTGSGRVYINGGSISDAQGNGIFVRNALARVSNTTITGYLAQGIFGTAGAGQQTTVEVTGSVITNTVGINGLALQATGGGIVNGTLLNTAVEVQLNSLDAIVLDAASSMFVNAAGNFGATVPPPIQNFNLNNAAGGLLQIDQASIADLITVNNGVAVGAVGVTFNGSTPPVPPPTP